MDNLDVKNQYSLISSIKPSPVKWIWYPYFPAGKITVLQGDPGEGKSTIMMDVISRLTKGRQFPDGSAMNPVNVIIQCSEDSLTDTIRPRLEAAGADCDRIANIHEDIFGLSLDDEIIRNTIVDFNAKLLVIDPFQAYIGEADLSCASSMRRMLRRLSMWASMYDCAIVLVGHLSKKSGTKELYRGLGSIDVVAAARSVLQIDREDNSDTRVMRHIKSSLSPRGREVGFSISNAGTIIWNSINAEIPDEKEDANVLNNDSTNQKQESLTALLKERLSNGPIAATDLLCSVDELGVSERTVRLTKRILGIKSIKKDNKWYWSLPTDGANNGKEI